MKNNYSVSNNSLHLVNTAKIILVIENHGASHTKKKKNK